MPIVSKGSRKIQHWAKVSAIKTYTTQGVMVRWVELRLPVGATKDPKLQTSGCRPDADETGYASASESTRPTATIASRETATHSRSSAIKACARFERRVSWSPEVSFESKEKTIRPEPEAVKPKLTSPLSLTQRKVGGISHLQAMPRAIDLAENLDGN